MLAAVMVRVKTSVSSNPCEMINKEDFMDVVCLCHKLRTKLSVLSCHVSLLQRMDLGECRKIHDLALRADYQLANKNKDYYFDVDVSFCFFLPRR